MGSEGNPPEGSGPSGENTGSADHEAWKPPSQPEPRAEDYPETPESPPPAYEQEGGRHRQPPSGGSMRFQDPATTRPRPPTVGETRARDKAERKRREAEKARVEAELKRYERNRRLMGGAAAVGVVGVVAALGYWALSPKQVTAQCVQEDATGGPTVVPDNYCTGRTGDSSGLFFYSGHQYRSTTTAAPEALDHGRWVAPRSSRRVSPSRRRRAPPLSAVGWAASSPAAVVAEAAVREARQNAAAAGLAVDRGDTRARVRHARA